MLEILVFLGSVRTSTPPAPARLGLRVARACMGRVIAKGMGATLIDPLDYRPDGAFKPHFAYRAGQAPAALDDLAQRIARADGFVMVSPEYNHSMSPALADLLNHFGSSLFSYKPSVIATYSAGQWGGTRAAMGMRGFLSELGCLPVSAMIHVPHAQDVWDADGICHPGVDATRWQGYLDRGMDQLVWWATAARDQRAAGTGTVPAPFSTTPQQRDAP